MPTTREIGAMIVFAALFLMLILLIVCSPNGPATGSPGPIVTPSTYGPPGPNGGPQ